MAGVRITDRDNGFRRLVQTVRQMGKTTVRVGVNDQPHAGSPGLTNADLGAIHEFGLGHVPERSFLRAWADDRQGWFPKLKGYVLGALLGREAYGEAFGKFAVEGVRARIRLGIPPPLAEATVRRKLNGSTPLIETEQLIDAIEFDVQENGR